MSPRLRAGGRRDSGQAAVELALVLPVLGVLALLLLQAALLVRDQVRVTHAAREAAREAAVTPDRARIRRAAEEAAGLEPSRLSVRVSGRDGPDGRVTVRVGYRAPTDVPLVGRAVGDVTVRDRATMRVEG